MPKHTADQLQWSSAAQQYAVLHDGVPVTPAIKPDGPRWFDWLESIASFAFQSRSGGSCTVRKEAVQRSGSYWYAYRRQGSRIRLAKTTPACHDCRISSTPHHYPLAASNS